MDVFNNPYWSLEQLHAWALTRDRDLVSMTAPTDDGAPAGQRLDIQIRIAISHQKAFKKGRDIQSELWSTSGINPEKYAAHDHGIQEPSAQPITALLIKYPLRSQTAANSQYWNILRTCFEMET
jgi:hypothetical protein